ncbi:hypothetical protein ACM66B_003389 [Microbotryomycetes sp. NB124-2]
MTDPPIIIDGSNYDKLLGQALQKAERARDLAVSRRLEWDKQQAELADKQRSIVHDFEEVGQRIGQASEELQESKARALRLNKKADAASEELHALKAKLAKVQQALRKAEYDAKEAESGYERERQRFEQLEATLKSQRALEDQERKQLHAKIDAVRASHDELQIKLNDAAFDAKRMNEIVHCLGELQARPTLRGRDRVLRDLMICVHTENLRHRDSRNVHTTSTSTSHVEPSRPPVTEHRYRVRRKSFSMPPNLQVPPPAPDPEPAVSFDDDINSRRGGSTVRSQSSQSRRRRHLRRASDAGHATTTTTYYYHR